MNRHSPLLYLAPILLLASVLFTPTSALASSYIQPGVFALTLQAFPQGSQLMRSGIESNRQLLRDDPGHFVLPPAHLGRLTGYYMNAAQGDPAARDHAYTSYMISIFKSSRQARSAYEQRWGMWFDMNYYTTPSPAPIAVGDRNEGAFFHTLNPQLPPLSELLFLRGPVLIEVFQGAGTTDPTADQLRSFWAIASELDALAHQHRTGV